MLNKSQLVSLLAIISIVGVASIVGLAQPIPKPSGSQDVTNGSPKYAYLFGCSGAYAKIDNRQHSLVAEGSIWDAASLSPVQPDTGGRFDGCLLDDVQTDQQGDTIFAVVPVTARLSPDGTREYRVVSVKLPGFVLVSKAGPFGSKPTLLRRPDGNLLIEGNGGELVQTPTLDPVKQPIQMGHFEISAAAYWSAAGTIIDRNQILDQAGRVLRQIDGYALLPNALRQRLQRRTSGGRNYLQVDFADSSSGRMLFVAGQDSGTQQKGQAHNSGLIVFDTGNNQTLAAIGIPYQVAGWDPTRFDTPTVHLVPNTDLAVVEEYEWRVLSEEAGTVPDSQKYQRVKTGRFAIYNIKLGEAVRTVALEGSPGPLARVIGFSPDGGLMFYGSASQLYIVDLTGNEKPTAIAMKRVQPNQGFPPLAIVFANQ